VTEQIELDMNDHRLWPGKTLHPEPNGPQWHPATFHCLDVAAVADNLLRRNATWCRRIARSLDASEDVTRRLLVRLVVLHDIGKLTRGFCQMVGHELPVPARHRATPLRHWEASYELLTGRLKDAVETLLGVGSRGARRQLCAAVAGHHGVPPAKKASRFEDWDGVPAALGFIGELSKLVPGDDTWDLNPAAGARLSWTVAGLTVLADWIGSNSERFPYASHETPTATYWEESKRLAEVAVQRAGVGGSAVAQESTLRSLFGIEQPRPMQAAAAEVEIGDAPMMVVIEDATGSGKTESAVLLAQRMMAQGLGEGIYVALPTMATANAMFGRLGDSYRALFVENAFPSLGLAHGRRAHDPRFAEAVAAGLRAERIAKTGMPDEQTIEGTEVATFCSAWIADDRRKTFNAEVGVGTIDQAFLGILPVKFSVLRLIGLARRVLIVDEAHACDPYMEAELCRLLQMQATLGGSAIVMTATLTSDLREKLVAAYRLGLGVATNDFLPHADYPSLTVARAETDRCLDLGITPCAATTRDLPVKRLDSIDEAVALIVTCAKAGATVAWVRNTVDDVIDGRDRVATALEGIEGCDVELFHTRFAMGDRLDVERRVLERYGRNGSGERRGRILVASQVIEASLDLDFDAMVSDLAPIDSLIQRAGRLWRHLDIRPPAGRPVDRAVLHVLSPDPDVVDSGAWGRDRFGGSGFVYGTSVLWRSARALFDAGRIEAPGGLRDLLESVVGDARPDVPAPLEQDENALLGRDYADAARSRGNAVRPSEGYASSAVQGTDISFPTRADTDGCRVVLVRRDGKNLVPWIADDSTAMLSEIGLRQYRYEKLVQLGGAPHVPEVPRFAEDWPTWRKEALRMLIVDPDGSVGAGARYDRVGGLRNVPDAGIDSRTG